VAPAAGRPRKPTYAERRERRAAVQDLGEVVDFAARYLEARPRSVAEVRRRLGSAGYRAELVEPAIARLGDLGYLDDDRNLFFAGRNADWIRVDGENFPAGPIEAALARHPDVVLASVYGVPDEQAGDQVMAAVVLRPDVTFDPTEFARWIDALVDVGPKWRPRYVRVAAELPTTGTNKVVKRTLVHQKFRRDRIGSDTLFVRPRGAESFAPFDTDDEAALLKAFVAAGRERFWDL